MRGANIRATGSPTKEAGQLLQSPGTVRVERIIVTFAAPVDALRETIVGHRSAKVGTSRAIRARAIFPEGSLEIAAERDPDVADIFNIRRWAEIAGTRIRLGDSRPRRGGLFGRRGRILAGAPGDDRADGGRKTGPDSGFGGGRRGRLRELPGAPASEGVRSARDE